MSRVGEEQPADTRIYEGTNVVRIILVPEESIVNNDELNWKSLGSKERCITLWEIYQHFKELGHEGVILVWEESPQEGIIYICGNYEEGQWIKHGLTRGYA